MGLLQAIFSIAWWAFVIVAIVYVVRWLRSAEAHPAKEGRSALEVLRVRYARGEIDKREFEEKKRDIENGPPTGTGAHDAP